MVIKKFVNREITCFEAARILNMSVKHIFRLRNRYLTEGESFVIRKNTGKTPAHATPKSLKQKIINLYLSKYNDANF